MSIQYRVYGNNLMGGPVDFTTLLATVSGLTWDTPPLPENADATFVVRSYDTVSGFESLDSSARVRIRLGPDGDDLASYPAAPFGLVASPRSGGSVRISFSLPPRSGATGVHVYLGLGTPSYAAPMAVVGLPPGAPPQLMTALLSGLTGGLVYAVAVRAFNATGEEPNTAFVTFTAIAAGPAPAIALSGSATP